MAKIVYDSRQFCGILKHIATELNTRYDNHFPRNLGYNYGSGYSWDCWNLPKSLIWGWKEGGAVGSYQRADLSTGLGDWNGWTILNCCAGISTNFSSISPGEFLLTEDKGHAGVYVGDFKDRYGQLCNVVECTTSWSTSRVIGSWVDADGTRRNCKGGQISKSWHWHGKLPWVDYAEIAPAPVKKIAEDGSWGMDTTRWTQRLLGTHVDGIVSNQPRSNKKYLPNAYTGSWQFKLFGYKGGSDMIRALQRLIGATADGYFGKDSVSHLQLFLANKGFYNGAIDGVMGYNTVLGWQKYINASYA